MEHLPTKEKQIDDQWEHKKSLTSRPGRENMLQQQQTALSPG